MRDIDKVIKQESVINTIENAQNSYVIGSGIMPIIRAVPIIGDMISTGVEKTINDFQEKKQKQLIDCILENSELITIERVNDVEFIINFSKTIEAVKRLATNDKVKYFGNLLRNGYLCEERINNNDFEEFSNIINELSYREIMYLSFFVQNKSKFTGSGGWKEFTQKFQKEFNIKPSDTYGIFTRLKRTGFVDEIYETGSGDVSDNQIEQMDIYGEGFELTKSINYFCKIVLNMQVK